MPHPTYSETIARWSVYLLFALTPFFFIPVPWVSIGQAKMLFATVVAVIGLIAWITASLNQSNLRVPRNSLMIAAALIPIAYLVSALATGASWGSFVGEGRGQDTVMWFVISYVALFLSVILLDSKSRLRTALRLFMIGAAGVLLVQITHLALPAFEFGGALPVAAASIVGSWHDLAIFLGLVVFVSVMLVRTWTGEGYWSYFSVALGVTAFLLLVLVNYSDVWIGLFGLCLFRAFFLYRVPSPDQGFSRSRSIFLWLLFAAAALGLYFGGNTIQTVLPSSLQITQIEVRPSWSGTLEVGKQAFAEPARMFFGTGPNTFPREWGLYKPLSVNTTQFWNTDFYYGVGFIPTSLVTTGAAGLIAWGAVCIALLWGLRRLFLRASTASVLHVALMGSALYLTIFHILYVPGPALSLITFLIFGALIAQELWTTEARKWSLSLAWGTWRGKAAALALSLFGIAVFFGGVQVVRALASDSLVNRAIIQYNRSQDLSPALRSVAFATSVLSSNDRAHRAAVELGILQLYEINARGDTSEQAVSELRVSLTTTIQHGLTAVSIEGRNYQNWFTLARLYGELAGAGIEGAEQSARDAYAEAIRNYPTSPLPYLELARLDIFASKDVEARENLEEALRIKPDLAAAHFLFSQVYARAGYLGSAQQHGQAVVQIAPEDSLGWYNLGTILYAQENFEDVVSVLERAVELQNDYSNALFLLGLSYYQLDRQEDALKVLRTVAVLNPDNEGLAETISNIEAGQSSDPDSE